MFARALHNVSKIGRFIQQTPLTHHQQQIRLISSSISALSSSSSPSSFSSSFTSPSFTMTSSSSSSLSSYADYTNISSTTCIKPPSPSFTLPKLDLISCCEDDDDGV
eukprot:TRINITY_DN14890_c0_g1_i2.p1 TRINITY_DN14890_c0_g1~~TRINITY_DN14890_c0_g1_i2.p1  ORF type:complete len:114 (+),score=39.93 TRINITY_DN14890_c0_g1_i2:22-342(+)